MPLISDVSLAGRGHTLSLSKISALEWARTLFEERPWPNDKVPAVIHGVPQPEQPEHFFHVHVWHCFHAGVGKA